MKNVEEGSYVHRRHEGESKSNAIFVTGRAFFDKIC